MMLLTGTSEAMAEVEGWAEAKAGVVGWVAGWAVDSSRCSTSSCRP